MRLQKIDHVSRQAVYDNIKEREKILEDYEKKKLHMFSDYMMREDLLEQYLSTHQDGTIPKMNLALVDRRDPEIEEIKE